MKRTTMRLNVLALALLPAMAMAQTVEKQADGVIVRPADARAADVRLQQLGCNPPLRVARR